MIVAHTLMLAGAVLIVLAAAGVMRFRDVLARMHAFSKASTLGFVLVLLGGTIGLDDVDHVTFVLLAAGLQVITSPVAANLIALATYRAEGIPHHLDEVDELASRPSPDDEAG